MTIKSYADTSAVNIAYAFSNAAERAEVGSLDMTFVPFRSEGFTMAKDAQVSQAITSSRRVTGSKNTKGTASGSFVVEFGASGFCKDFLAAALMSDWEDEGGSKVIRDGETKKYMLMEKVIRPNAGAALLQSVENYYGTLINDATLEIGDGELITLTANTMSANAEYREEVQGNDGLGGSVAANKILPDPYELADGSNNIGSIVVYDSNNTPMEMTFSSASLGITNNVREQSAVGKVFAAGIGMGKVGVTLSGEVYYYDQSVLAAHMENKTMRVEMTLETEEGQFKIDIPRVKAQSPSSNAQGENQDYMTSLELVAEEGLVGGKNCMIQVAFTENPVPKVTSLNLDITGDDLDIAGVTANIGDTTVVTLIISDEHNNVKVATTTVSSDAFSELSYDLAGEGFEQGDFITVEARILVSGKTVSKTANIKYSL
jgi:hypothetical protein